MISHLEAAAIVWFGEYQSIDPDNLQYVTEENPESILIAKELLTNLSREAKEVVTIIINSPEEMFLKSGSFRQMELRKILRKKGWGWKKVLSVQKELQEICRNFYEIKSVI